MNINGSQPIKINVNEIMREKRELWENANIDKSKDKDDWSDEFISLFILIFFLNNLKKYFS